MRGKNLLIILLALTILAPSLVLGSQLRIVEPSGTDYSWGSIPLSVSFTDSYGDSINNASVTVQWETGNTSLTYNSTSERYEGTANIIKMGDYTFTALTTYNGENFSDSKQIHVNSSKVEVSIVKPTGDYGAGTIPVQLEVKVGGEEGNTTATLSAGNITKTVYPPYVDVIDLGEGDYTITATVSADNNNATATSDIHVSKDILRTDIVNPRNQTYSKSIPVDADVWSNSVFVHHIQVTGKVYENGTLVYAFPIPESQDHYSTTINLDPGYYKLVVEANRDDNIVRDTIYFGVEGIVQTNNTTVVIPKKKEMDWGIIWTDLKRRYYSKGAEGVIAVILRDPFTGLEIPNANVSCCVFVDAHKECFQLNGDGVYQNKYMFGEEGWYEIKVNASALGYEKAMISFPPIQVGKPEIKPPAGYEEIDNYMFTIMSPEKDKTYPENKGLPLRIQLLTKEGMPVTDANVTARLVGIEFPLDYDINGEYYAETEPIAAGTYNLTFTVSHNETTFQRSTKVYVSANKLNVQIVSPVNGTNITSNNALIQALVKDQSGDIVPDANVEAIMTSPESGPHTISLTRNLETGYYELNYTLDAPGKWKVKIVASKIGLISGSDETNFIASFEKQFTISTKDVVAGAIIIASIIIIVIILRAML